MENGEARGEIYTVKEDKARYITAADTAPVNVVTPEKKWLQCTVLPTNLLVDSEGLCQLLN